MDGAHYDIHIVLFSLDRECWKRSIDPTWLVKIEKNMWEWQTVSTLYTPIWLDGYVFIYMDLYLRNWIYLCSTVLRIFIQFMIYTFAMIIKKYNLEIGWLLDVMMNVIFIIL